MIRGSQSRLTINTSCSHEILSLLHTQDIGKRGLQLSREEWSAQQDTHSRSSLSFYFCPYPERAILVKKPPRCYYHYSANVINMIPSYKKMFRMYLNILITACSAQVLFQEEVAEWRKSPSGRSLLMAEQSIIQPAHGPVWPLDGSTDFHGDIFRGFAESLRLSDWGLLSFLHCWGHIPWLAVIGCIGAKEQTKFITQTYETT